MHACLTASFSKKTPHLLLSSQNQNQPPYAPLSLLKQPGASLIEQIVQTPLKPETSLFTHGLLQQIRHVGFRRGLDAPNSAVICTFRRSTGLRSRSSRYGVRNPSTSSNFYRVIQILEVFGVKHSQVGSRSCSVPWGLGIS